MKAEIERMLAELRQGLSRVYGERLEGAYVFGSYARGDADEESDVDVLIVLDDVEDYSAEIERTSELIAALSLRYGVSISRVFAPVRRWREDQTMFFVNVREEAIPA